MGIQKGSCSPENQLNPPPLWPTVPSTAGLPEAKMVPILRGTGCKPLETPPLGPHPRPGRAPAWARPPGTVWAPRRDVHKAPSSRDDTGRAGGSGALPAGSLLLGPGPGALAVPASGARSSERGSCTSPRGSPLPRLLTSALTIALHGGLFGHGFCIFPEFQCLGFLEPQSEAVLLLL